MRIVKAKEVIVHVFVTDATHEEVSDEELMDAVKMHDDCEWKDHTVLTQNIESAFTTLDKLKEEYGDVIDCIEEQL